MRCQIKFLVQKAVLVVVEAGKSDGDSSNGDDGSI